MINFEEVYQYLNEKEPEIANSIYYASEMLLSQIDKAIEALRKRRVEAVNNDEDEECERLRNYRDRLKEYKEDINTYLNYATNSVKSSNNEEDSPFIPGFKSDSDITQDEMYTSPTDYSKYNVDNSKPHTLDETFTHKKICAFMFRREKHVVNNWQDTLVKLCNLLSTLYPSKITSLVSNPKFEGRKVSYFSYNYVKGKNIKIDGTSIYVWINLSANDIVKVITNLLIEFDEQPNEFYIYLRADYTELHYGEQASQPKVINDDEEKIGKHVKKCMRKLEAKNYTFSHNELLALKDTVQSKKLFGITYPFFIESKNMIYDKNGRGRYWKDPFKFNGELYYITSQWYEHNRNKFDAWFKRISKNVR